MKPRIKVKNGICIICLPNPAINTGAKPTYQLLKVLKKVRKNVSFIGGIIDKNNYINSFRNIPYFKIAHYPQKSPFGRIISFLKIQIMISLAIRKSKNIVDIYLFFIGGEVLLLPHIIAKIYRKRTFFLLAGFPSKGSAFKKDPFFILEEILSKANFLISNKILVYSPRIIQERKLNFFRNKIDIFCKSYISDSEINFVDISEKDDTIGFLGDISSAKGVQNLIIAFKMLQYKVNFTLHLGGIGDSDYIKKLLKYANNNGFRDKLIYYGWINREDIPNFFSKIKYFVLPSISEGIPNVILEAMGSGCCVISTPVGGIRDVIIDNFNGLIINNNSPKSIYEGILRANSSDLKKISINAFNTIKEKYSFDNAVKNICLILKKDQNYLLDL